MSTGIDYGMGQTNIDEATGIRYGVISSHEVMQSWADNSEGDYGKPSCPECEGKVIDAASEQANKREPENGWEGNGSDYVCLQCKIIWNSEDVYPEEAIAFTYEEDGISIFAARRDTIPQRDSGKIFERCIGR